VLVYLFKVLALLPLGFVQALGAGLGQLAYWGSPGYRRRMHANILQAGLGRDVLRAAIGEAGKQSLETAWVWLRSREDLARKIEWADEAILKRALAAGPPIIILTPHLGCFEAVAQGYALRPEARERPMTALYRVPRKDALRPLVEGARAQDGLVLAPANLAGVRRLMRALKQRQVLGILPDQVPAEGDGVWAPFFGRSAYTMVLPSKLACAAGGDAIVLVLGAERLPRGRGFRIFIEPLREKLTDSAERNAAAINRAIEAMVMRFPAQYLWGYNRYKRPAGARRDSTGDAVCGIAPKPAEGETRR